MERMCLTIPVRPGRRDELVEFMREVDGPRHDELGATERGSASPRGALPRRRWRPRLAGDVPGRRRSGTRWGLHRLTEPFDMWFKERFAACTGVDLNDPPPLEPAELLAAYAAEEVRA